jgi:peroxiredoxin
LGETRRKGLPGNSLKIAEITDTRGEAFDWDAYRGKVVLVDFWAGGVGLSPGQHRNMKRLLEAYGEQDFAIVGINLDQTLKACEDYIEKEGLTWTNLFSDNPRERGNNNPLAKYYGIAAVPTRILVDKEGKVVSLEARGKELDRLLQEMLGDPPGAPKER